jgi:hypothetical protein
VNREDPVGLLGAGAPEDEYDPEVEELIKWRGAVTAEQVRLFRPDSEGGQRWGRPRSGARSCRRIPGLRRRGHRADSHSHHPRHLAQSAAGAHSPDIDHKIRGTTESQELHPDVRVATQRSASTCHSAHAGFQTCRRLDRRSWARSCADRSGRARSARPCGHSRPLTCAKACNSFRNSAAVRGAWRDDR